MDIKYPCSECGAVLTVPEEHLGKWGTCNKCGKRILLRDKMDELLAETRSAKSLVVRFVFGFIALATLFAVGIVWISVSRAREQTRQEVAAANRIAHEAEAPLAQLSGGDPEKLKQLIDQAKDFALRGGGRRTTWSEQYNDALHSIFLMESSGVNTEENRNMFAALCPIIPGSPGELAKIALRYQRVFGEKEAGSLSQIISKALVVTKMGGGEVPAVLQAASNAGVVIVSRGLKWTDEEVLAAIGSTSIPMGGPEKAGKGLEAFAAAMADLATIGSDLRR